MERATFVHRRESSLVIFNLFLPLVNTFLEDNVTLIDVNRVQKSTLFWNFSFLKDRYASLGECVTLRYGCKSTLVIHFDLREIILSGKHNSFEDDVIVDCRYKSGSEIYYFRVLTSLCRTIDTLLSLTT